MNDNVQRIKCYIMHNIKQLGDFKAKYIATSGEHTAIIDLDNNIWTFGDNTWGQLGLGDNLYKENLTKIENLKAKQISLSKYHTVILDMENNVWVCGLNKFGQLGLGDSKDRYIPTQIIGLKAHQILAKEEYTLFIDLENNIRVCGRAYTNIPVVKFSGMKVKQISAGHSHIVMIDMKNNVLTYGRGWFGELGLGILDVFGCIDFPKHIALKAQQIFASDNSTVVIDMENNVWAFGHNRYGRLGLGDENDRNIPTKILNIKARKIIMRDYATAIITM